MSTNSDALAGKNAIIYGAGGGLGSGIATAFAASGARVFLTGRTANSLTTVATEITEVGGRAEVAVVDALDEQAVAAHAESVVAEAGSIDISLNLISRGDVQGIPLVDMAADDLLRAVAAGLATNHITAKVAARQMIKQGGGVILALNSGSAHGSPMMGSTGPADAAIDTFVRNLAQEIGPHGVRVVGIWTAGVPETLTAEKLASVDGNISLDESAVRELLSHLDSIRMLRRSPRLAQVADAAVFLASEGAAAITGTFVNVPSGTFAS